MSMKRAFLLAHPAGHSLSPAMHNAAFRHLGLAARYEALDVPPEGLAEAVQSLRREGVYGANVTIPHKEAVMALADELTEAARQIGAVNTLVNRDGKLVGHNTDASGFLRALIEDAAFDASGKKVLLLGAGGSARAIAYALLKAGAARISLYNRTRQRALALAGSFAALGTIEALEERELEEAARQADLLVNTTSVGMERGGVDPKHSPLPPGLLPTAGLVWGLVCDIIYRPLRTQLLLEAEAAGLRTQNGLPMLVYQGAEAFTLWTGEKAPASVMLAALKAALR